MSEQIRAFIAIELDDAMHRTLASVQERLKHDRAARLVRWVTPDSIHITLKFLGDVGAEQMPVLQRALVNACHSTPSFSLTLDDLGAFPNTRRPNNIWVGTTGQIDAATELAKKIEEVCAELGFSREERPFTPHLTLGRVKKDVSFSERASIGAMLDAAKIETLGNLHVDHISVMKSELRPSGSVYTKLAMIQLANEPTNQL